MRTATEKVSYLTEYRRLVQQKDRNRRQNVRIVKEKRALVKYFANQRDSTNILLNFMDA